MVALEVPYTWNPLGALPVTALFSLKFRFNWEGGRGLDMNCGAIFADTFGLV